MDDTRPRHLLLVEDDDELRGSFERALSTSFEVTALRDGGEAQRFLDRTSKPVDCIITDLRMPERGGLELVEHLRARGSDVPVLLVTAYADVETWLDARDLQVHAVLSKPVKPSFLKWCAQRAVGPRAGRGGPAS